MKKMITAFQWSIFMIAVAMAAPIAIASLYDLSAAETTKFVQQTIFLVGISGLLQGLLGHQLPIHEGPAGVWWSVFTIYASLVGVTYTSGNTALRALSGGMIMSGIFLIVFALFGLIEKLSELFTPTVTFVYLLLLVLQLGSSAVKGMLGITATHPTIEPLTALLSIITVAVTFYLGHSSIKWLRQYSVMFALLLGWLLFILFGIAPSIEPFKQIISLPKVFIFGSPIFDSGSIVSAFFIALLLVTNLVASVRLMENVLTPEQPSDHRRYFRGGLISGINQILGGGFSSVGPVPNSSAAGFVSQTGNQGITSFVAGAGVVMVVALFPPIMNVISALPVAVGYAVVFEVFVNMAVMAIREIKKVTKQEEKLYTVMAVSLMTGVGIMFLPATAMQDFPPICITVLSNGLIVGSVLAIVLEQCLCREKKVVAPVAKKETVKKSRLLSTKNHF